MKPSPTAEISPRQRLLQLYQQALKHVNGERCVRRALEQLDSAGEWRVAAVGKAAASMLHGALKGLEGRIAAALLITKYGHLDGRFPAWVEIIEAGHPLPDSNSLYAGERLATFVASGEGPLLFLLSGGASALVERLPDAVGLEELQQANDWLQGSGLDIRAMNAVRRRLSLLKGGRLLAHVRTERLHNWMLSDVPGDAAEVIGSGPMIPPSDVSPLLAEVTERLPEWLQAMLALADVQSTLSGLKTQSIPVDSRILAGNDEARAAVVAAAGELGLSIQVDEGPFTGDAAVLGEAFARQMLEGPPGLYLWGGESTVTLPVEPGRGGRSQHLALSAARVLTGHDGLFLLAAGTDGGDGPGEDAGALVDGGTLRRGEEEGLDALAALRGADSGGFLEAAGDLLQTGPTGTNVMDLVIGLKTV